METKIIKEIIAKHTKIDVDKLDLNANFKTDLHLDSIDLFQIIMEVEEALHIKIDNDKLVNIKTIKDALDSVENVK